MNLYVLLSLLSFFQFVMRIKSNGKNDFSTITIGNRTLFNEWIRIGGENIYR